MPERPKKIQVRKRGTGEGGIAPWHPSEFLHDVDRIFEDSRRRLESTLSPFAGGWLTPGRLWFEMPELRHTHTDLIDSGSEYRVLAEVPGIPKEKLEVTITDREVRIEGEGKTGVQSESEGFVRRERSYSKVSRSLMFPQEVIPSMAEATLNNGVLEIKVPKKSPTKGVKKHRVPVK